MITTLLLGLAVLLALGMWVITRRKSRRVIQLEGELAGLDRACAEVGRARRTS